MTARKTEKAIGALFDGAHGTNERQREAAFLPDDPGRYTGGIANRAFIGTDGERMMKALRCCRGRQQQN
jgi:hypothetical protein